MFLFVAFARVACGVAVCLPLFCDVCRTVLRSLSFGSAVAHVMGPPALSGLVCNMCGRCSSSRALTFVLLQLVATHSVRFVISFAVTFVTAREKLFPSLPSSGLVARHSISYSACFCLHNVGWLVVKVKNNSRTALHFSRKGKAVLEFRVRVFHKDDTYPCLPVWGAPASTG